MYDASRRLRFAMAAALGAVAILGYLAGHGRSAAAAPQRIRNIHVGGVVVGAPADWIQAAGVPSIPGLAIAEPVVLAPGGEAGFLTGQMPVGEPSPLSSGLLAELPSVPHTEIVNLVEGQAYRYSELNVPGFARMLTLYVIPNAGGAATVVGCYASKRVSAELPTCERIVATVTLVGHSQSYYLTPEPGYAHQLNRTIEALDRQRVALRSEMHARPAISDVQGLAARLADGFAAAATSLSLMEPPLVAHRAQVVLKSSIARAHDAYLALAEAARARSPVRYNAARTQVDEAEAIVSRALENFATLGYQ